MAKCKECGGTNNNEDGVMVHKISCQTGKVFHLILALRADLPSLEIDDLIEMVDEIQDEFIKLSIDRIDWHKQK